jgi:multidrug efflux pump subunit AcrA (membrane-fusion protein)
MTEHSLDKADAEKHKLRVELEDTVLERDHYDTVAANLEKRAEKAEAELAERETKWDQHCELRHKGTHELATQLEKVETELKALRRVDDQRAVSWQARAEEAEAAQRTEAITVLALVNQLEAFQITNAKRTVSLYEFIYGEYSGTSRLWGILQEEGLTPEVVAAARKLLEGGGA